MSINPSHKQVTKGLLRLCHIDPPRSPCCESKAPLGRTASHPNDDASLRTPGASLQSGFALLAPFVCHLFMARVNTKICLSLFLAASLHAKVLLLIIASDDFPVYPECQKTWRAYMHADPLHVEAYFIRADPALKTQYKIKGDTIWSKTEECQFPGILIKTVCSLKALSSRLHEFDAIIRTNLSSFFIFPRLLEFLQTLPKTGCYCGPETGPNSQIASGTGIILSPDLAERLIAQQPWLLHYYPRKFPDHSTPPDDAIIAAFFRDRGVHLIPTNILHIETLEYWNQVKDQIPKSIFHIRIKTDNPVRIVHDPLIGAELLKMFYGINRT